MGKRTRVENSVNKSWRRSVHRLFTACPRSMHQICTDLLTITSAAEEKLTNDAQRSRLKADFADIWAAARLGFSGAKALTIDERKKPKEFVLWEAFRAGQTLHNEYKAMLKDHPDRSPSAGTAQ